MTVPRATIADVRRFSYNRWLEVETRPFFLTSEHFYFVIFSIALLISCAVDNSLDSPFYWRWQIVLLVGYMLSRGIAKAGSRSSSYDPRDEKLAEQSRR